MSRFDYDLVVLGSGFSGSLTALLCRALGWSVLLVEKTDHPHFSIGEAVVGEVLRRLDYLAERYNVPVIANLSSYTRIKNAGLPISTWPKAHVTFVQHTKGRAVSAEHPEEVMVQASTWPIGPDAHAYRPDYDLFLKNTAVEHGAIYSPHTEALSFTFDAERGSILQLKGPDGVTREVTSRLVVDATGPACWLSRHLGVYRPDNPEVPMSSGAIFAHFEGVNSWDTVLGATSLVFPRDHGTILHVGTHGLFWVIRFDNGRTSAGWVTPEPLPPGANGEELFWNMLKERPSMAAHMAGARAVTPYYTINRVQYSASSIVGDGWFLLPPSSEFSDPLFSVGLPLSVASISRLLWRLESCDRSRPVLASDLHGLDDVFKRESKYIRKFTKATKRCFADYRTLNWAINVQRLLVFREGAYIGASTGPEASAAAAWGFDDELMRGMTDAFYDAVMSTDFDRPITDDVLARLDKAIRPYDIDGFLDTAFGRYRSDGVYLNSVPRMLHYFLKARHQPLNLGKVGGFVTVARRWFENMPSIVPPQGATPLPMLKGIVRDQIKALVHP